MQPRCLMKIKIVLCIVFALSPSGAAADGFLDDYLWKNRVLVISAPDEKLPEFQEMKRRLAGVKAETLERDMVVVEIVGTKQPPVCTTISKNECSAARTELSISDDTFASILIGKDGTVKLRTKEVPELSKVFALIDSMPMRRREMRERSE